MILSTQRIPGGDLVENGCFIEFTLANVCGFFDFDRGAMRQKMAIFKEGTAFAGVQKILNGEIFMNFIGGLCDRKRRFSK